MKTHSYLTEGLRGAYGDRKIPGRLSILVDLREDPKIYAVPREQEHIDFVKELLGTEDEQDVREQGALLVPSHIQITPNGWKFCHEVTGFLTGVSGLEIAFGVRHPREVLKKAHVCAKQFAETGELPFAEKIAEDKVLYRYASD